MLHEALMITSLSCVPLLLYKPALGWLRKKKISTHGAEALAEEGSPAAAAVRWCGRCLSAWLILHLLILLSLVRGISSGGGAFAPELDKWQVGSLSPWGATLVAHYYIYIVVCGGGTDRPSRTEFLLPPRVSQIAPVLVLELSRDRVRSVF